MLAKCTTCGLTHNTRYNCQTGYYEHDDGRVMSMAEALNNELIAIQNEKDQANKDLQECIDNLDPMMKEASTYDTENDQDDKKWWDLIYFHYSPAEMTPLFQISDLMGD